MNRIEESPIQHQLLYERGMQHINLTGWPAIFKGWPPYCCSTSWQLFLVREWENELIAQSLPTGRISGLLSVQIFSLQLRINKWKIFSSSCQHSMYLQSDYIRSLFFHGQPPVACYMSNCLDLILWYTYLPWFMGMPSIFLQSSPALLPLTFTANIGLHQTPLLVFSFRYPSAWKWCLYDYEIASFYLVLLCLAESKY